MSKFLNKIGVIEAIKAIIEEAKHEIIIIVPYIKVSEHIDKLLKQADERDVETSIVYREDKLKYEVKQYLLSFKNLNLLYHPDVHSKCYLNEQKMVITSMNLYDYSEKYNREMGVLVEKDGYGSAGTYKEAMEEVRSIIQSAKIERKGQKAEATGFKLSLLKKDHERLFATCKLVNTWFDNKHFEVKPSNNNGELFCKAYYENMDVSIEPDFTKGINEETGAFAVQRLSVDFTWEEEHKKRVHDFFLRSYKELMFDEYKVYWSYYASSLTIYRDKWRQPQWNTLTTEQTIKKFQQGIDEVTQHIRRIERSVRN